MFAPEEMQETVDLMQCRSCAAYPKERDKFCRRCGLSLRPAPSAKLVAGAGWFECGTRSLHGSTGRGGSFSGTLVNLVTQSLSMEASSYGFNQWTMRFVAALVAVPLWVMIALLSPLDAYIAAKAITKLG